MASRQRIQLDGGERTGAAAALPQYGYDYR